MLPLRKPSERSIPNIAGNLQNSQPQEELPLAFGTISKSKKNGSKALRLSSALNRYEVNSNVQNLCSSCKNSKLSDWYLVSRKAIVNKGGSGLIEKYASVRRALMAIYPDFPWTLSITRSKYLKQLEVAEKQMGIQNVSYHLSPPPQPKANLTSLMLVAAGGLVLCENDGPEGGRLPRGGVEDKTR